VNVGRITVGGQYFAVGADTSRVARFTSRETVRISKGCVYLDGGGGGSAPQVCRCVIYSVSGADPDALIGVSNEVMVAPSQGGAWVDFLFSEYGGDLELPAGDFFVGLIAGGDDGVIRVAGDDPGMTGGASGADTYSDGPDALFPSPSILTADLSAYLAVFPAYESVRPRETDLYYSRLPFKDAQAALAGSGPDANVLPRLVLVGWHDTFLDPETGSVALVRDGSEIAGLLGERVKVILPGAMQRSVIAYVHNLADADVIDWDLSLPRHLMAQLAPLSTDTLEAVVEVVA
jgi:hypothetical protein